MAITVDEPSLRIMRVAMSAQPYIQLHAFLPLPFASQDGTVQFSRMLSIKVAGNPWMRVTPDSASVTLVGWSVMMWVLPLLGLFHVSGRLRRTDQSWGCLSALPVLAPVPSITVSPEAGTWLLYKVKS